MSLALSPPSPRPYEKNQENQFITFQAQQKFAPAYYSRQRGQYETPEGSLYHLWPLLTAVSLKSKQKGLKSCYSVLRMPTRTRSGEWYPSVRYNRRFFPHIATAAAPDVWLSFLMMMMIIQAATLNAFAVAAAKVIFINSGCFWWPQETICPVSAAKYICHCRRFLGEFLHLVCWAGCLGPIQTKISFLEGWGTIVES